ncbi:MAG: hypothetical protein HQL56_11500 [Magnetococcales bacterium]|nr:hypothetical protein [Magnetococcales bacterium]
MMWTRPVDGFLLAWGLVLVLLGGVHLLEAAGLGLGLVGAGIYLLFGFVQGVWIWPLARWARSRERFRLGLLAGAGTLLALNLLLWLLMLVRKAFY